MKRRIASRLAPRRGSGTLGTFAGVFTPSVLTILGIILFRRLGFVVGSAGLGQALLIISLASMISFLTSLSLSAIATNLRVKGGGDYYIISRTLGVEFGGSIGIVLFLAQAVSIAFYCIGFGEVLAGLLPETGYITPRMVAAIAIVCLFIFAWLGADWATRFQFVVMAALVGALISFFIGGFSAWSSEEFAANLRPSAEAPGFWFIFAIFFPAVTGFTQGVSMSGDLKDSGKSIPLGTFAAVGLSTLIYFGAALLLAGSLPGEVLTGDYNSMRRVAVVDWLIIAGVIAATLSSGMASFLGAPRILQALAADRIFPILKPFSAGAGPANNPRRAVLLAGGIALITVALGNLNLIAPVVSMFFLISYGLLNYATYYEARAASPSFRPRFKFFNKRLSLLGAGGCLIAMLAINPVAGAVGFSVLLAIYQYLKRMAGPARWADSSRSYLFQKIRENLFAMSDLPVHPRDWRPQILAFAKDDERREQILRFASWIEGDSGLTTAVLILKEERSARKACREAEEKLRAEISKRNLKAFSRVVSAPDFARGLDMLLQAHGIGPLRSNIVLLSWLEHSPGSDCASAERRYSSYLKDAFRLGRNLVVLDAEEAEWKRLMEMPPQERRIDVWWWNNATSRLMVLLAYLMTRTDAWEGAAIRVLEPRAKKTDRADSRLRQTLEEIRIEATSEVVENLSARALLDLSGDAALVFLPLRMRGTSPVDPFGDPVDWLLARLPVVASVAAAEDLELAAEPEEGKAAEIAEAVDRAQGAEKAARRAQREAEQAKEDAEKARKELQSLVSTLKDPSEFEKVASLVSLVQDASAAAEKAAKQAELSRQRAERAARKAEALGAKPLKKEEVKEKENGEGNS